MTLRAQFTRPPLLMRRLAASHYAGEQPETVSWQLVWLGTCCEAASVLVVAITCYDLLGPPTVAPFALAILDVLFGAIFFADWAAGLRCHLRAEPRGSRVTRSLGYLLHMGHLIDLATAVTPVMVLVSRGSEAFNLLRFVRVLRAATRLADVVQDAEISEIDEAPSALGVTPIRVDATANVGHPMFRATVLVFGSALFVVMVSQAIYHAENGTPDSHFKTRTDALWWAVSRLGYGANEPQTAEGRVLASLLVLFGLGVLATFTGHVAEYFTRRPRNRTDPRVMAALTDIRAHVDLVMVRVEQLASDVRHLQEHRGQPVTREPVEPKTAIDVADEMSGGEA